MIEALSTYHQRPARQVKRKSTKSPTHLDIQGQNSVSSTGAVQVVHKGIVYLRASRTLTPSSKHLGRKLENCRSLADDVPTSIKILTLDGVPIEVEDFEAGSYLKKKKRYSLSNKAS